MSEEIILSPAQRMALQLIPENSAWRVPTLLLQMPTSLDVSTEAGQLALANATGPADFVFDELDGQTFDVVHYVCWTDWSVDEQSGEVREHPRTTLIDKDGQTLQTTSEFVPHKLARLIAAGRRAPFDPPLRIEVVKRQSRRKGRVYHDLKILPRT